MTKYHPIVIFFVGLITYITGVMWKIMHWPYAYYVYWAGAGLGIAAFLIFIVQLAMRKGFMARYKPIIIFFAGLIIYFAGVIWRNMHLPYGYSIYWAGVVQGAAGLVICIVQLAIIKEPNDK